MNREEIGMCRMDQVEVREVEWLWYPYIPRGKVTILQGDPGGGKTTLALNIIAAVSQKRELPYGRKPDPVYPGFCVYQTVEDGVGDTVVPRLLKAGAKLSSVYYLKDKDGALEIGDDRLESLCMELLPDLVVLDPIQGFLGSHVDMHRANEIRPRMAYLSELAEVTGTAILLIGHMNKNSAGEAIYRGLGSIDIAAAARSVLLMERPKRSKYRVLRHIKSSLAAAGDPLAFNFTEDGQFRCCGKYTEEMQSAQPISVRVSYLLRTILGAETKPVTEIKERLSKEFGNISNNTWSEAKRLAQAETVKTKDGWCLRISPNANFDEEGGEEER